MGDRIEFLCEAQKTTLTHPFLYELKPGLMMNVLVNVGINLIDI